VNAKNARRTLEERDILEKKPREGSDTSIDFNQIFFSSVATILLKISKNPRLLCCFILLVITPLGILSKSYSGIGKEWVNDYSGDILYEIFWCVFIFFFLPQKKYILPIAIWVFVITCAIELLQLWQTPWLNSIRSTIVGKLILGTTFSLPDFPHYLFGSILGWLCLLGIYNLSRISH
jgi:hypothetical protein